MITPEQVKEWDDAESLAEHARHEDEIAQADLATATAHASQTAEARRQAEAREVAAEAAIVPHLAEGEMRGLHPEPIVVLMRQGSKLVRGKLKPAIGGPTP